MGVQAPQNFSNHRRFDRVYLAAGAILLLAVILSLADLVHGVTVGSLATALVAACALVMLVKMRMYSLSVQDRIIRLEMRLRLERVLPADLKGRIGGLSLQQLIGLRFASDEELPALVQQVFDGPITSADEIKKRIKNWQADHLRV